MPKYDLYIETDRLILRPFTLADIEPSYIMNLDSEVSKYTGDGGIVSKEEIERRITEDVLGDYEKHGYGRLAVQLKNGDSFIGFAGLKYLPDLDEIDLGYRLTKENWGKGLATEACKAIINFGFHTLKINRMVALVLPGNKASIHVLKKVGFTFEKEIIEDGELAHQYFLTSK
jgi:RimJ/RimL family protein N-acetyltransferase